VSEAARIGVLIVDDEPPAVERLSSMVSSFPECRVVGCESRAERVAARCRELRPDAVLLDIEMPAVDGLALARRLRAESDPPAVVFVTAHDRYAVEAFGVAATDYVVKPVRPERLRRALRRVQQARAGDDAEFVAAHVGGRLIRVPLADVRAFTAEDKCTVVHAATRRAVLDRPLKAVEDEWGDRFVRVHRNALASRYHLLSLYTDADGVERLEVDGLDHDLEVSRRNRSAVRRCLVGDG
jgi:two-component system response regulator AlgR